MRTRLLVLGWMLLAAGMARGQATLPVLPAGHPEIPGMQKPTLPNLPQGHPDISGMLQRGAPAPSTQPMRLGAVTIQARQGSKGAGPVAGEKATLKLYLADGQVFNNYEVNLDEKGQAVVKDIPIKAAVQPVVTIGHAGVEYQGNGPMLDPSKPDGVVEVAVYESTEERPAILVKMRHVMAQPQEGTLAVREMLVVENPADRAWLGAADAKGQRTTLALALPAGVENVSLDEGLHDCCAAIEDGKLINRAPLPPGITRIQYTYAITPAAGQATLSVGADVLTENLMVFLPAQGNQASAVGLESGTREMEGGQQVRYFMGRGLEAGKPVNIAVSNFAAAPARNVAAASAPKIVAAVGGGVLLVVAVAFFFIKAPKGAKK